MGSVVSMKVALKEMLGAGLVGWVVGVGKGEAGGLVGGHGVPLAASFEFDGEVGDVGVAAVLAAALGVVVGGGVEVPDGVGGLVGGMGGEDGRGQEEEFGEGGFHFWGGLWLKGACLSYKG